ncbi:hypothetical protein NFI96_008450, partial [Prochilodus magdalenae]
MADSKELVPVYSMVAPGFIEELVPSSKQISLMYHLSYLCLAKFPECERMIRSQALETQLLYSSSEAVLWKCMGTSENLVSTLFPKLVYSMEKNNPAMAVRYLENARTWITEIIQDMDETVQRYDEHNRNVSATTSDIIKEKRKTEEMASKLSTEINAMEDALEKLKQKLKQISNKVTETENQISSKSRELEEYVKRVKKTDQDLTIVAAVVPLIGIIVKSIYDAATDTGIAETTKALENQLNRLNSDKNYLKQQEWNLQLKVNEYQKKLAQKKRDHGAIPDPIHLGEVQQCLTKVQNILIQLKSFWEKVLAMLGVIQDKTFTDECLIKDPEEKDMFVSSIQEALKIFRKPDHQRNTTDHPRRPEITSDHQRNTIEHLRTPQVTIYHQKNTASLLTTPQVEEL